MCNIYRDLLARQIDFISIKTICVNSQKNKTQTVKLEDISSIEKYPHRGYIG